MLVIRQKMIYRSDLQANPNILYVFGDNMQREGMGGQAKEMRGEPNAFGIRTKRRPSHGSPDDYFHDNEKDAWDAVDEDIEALIDEYLTDTYTHIVIPEDGIGTGLARLQEFAPKLLNYINEQISYLEHI